MARYLNIEGNKYNRLTAIRYCYTNHILGGSAVWLWKCDCGREVEKTAGHVKSGLIKSCGCLNDETRRKKHVSAEHIKARKIKSWRDWYTKNRGKQIQKITNFIRDNRDLWNARRRKRTAERMKDPVFRITRNLRSKLRMALLHNVKSGGTINNLGCSVPELKKHIESKFYDRGDGTKMTWGNYGKSGWQIDHIVPLIMLRYGKTAEELSHYSNIQPLWPEDNLRKRQKDLQALGLVG